MLYAKNHLNIDPIHFIDLTPEAAARKEIVEHIFQLIKK